MNIVKKFNEAGRVFHGGCDVFAGVKIALIKFFTDNTCYFDVEHCYDAIYEDFTLNNMISLWSGKDIHLIEERSYALSENEIYTLDEIIKSKSVSLKNSDPGIIGAVYEASLKTQDKKATGSVYTPEDIAEYMADIIREKVTIQSKLIDPACGCGIFLSGFYDALMNRCCYDDDESLIGETHRKILNENIYGLDKSEAACAVSKIVLALKYKECFIAPNIIACDSLLSLPDNIKKNSFDYVVTNPPYMGHKQMENSYKKLISMFYSQVYYDKSDLSYCFFKLGYELLKKRGFLIFVTSRYFAQSLFAARLRQFLLDNFKFIKIVDFYGIRPFKNVGIDPMILYLQKASRKNGRFKVIKPYASAKRFDMRSEADSERFFMAQSLLNAEGFSFMNDRQRKFAEVVKSKCPLVLSDIADTFQGIISGADNAFTVNGKNSIYKECIEECGVKWIKSKDINDESVSFCGIYLLYTNSETKENLTHTLKKLSAYREMLLKRRECASGIREWYELQWPRERALFENPKIIFPYKSSRNKFITDREGYFFSADIYGITVKNEYKNKISEEKLSMYLNSAVCECYFKFYAKKLGNDMFEYYPNTVKRIALPPIETIEGFKDENEIFEYFGFTLKDLKGMNSRIL